MATPGIQRGLAVGPRIRSTGHFLRHVVEMVVAMFVGMAVFGGLFSVMLLVIGTTYEEALSTVPEVVALVLAFNMSALMVVWMRHRGHSRARIAEMVGAMFAAPAVAAIALLESGAVAGTAICGIECAVMLPAMLVVMLLRRDEYSQAPPARRR